MQINDFSKRSYHECIKKLTVKMVDLQGDYFQIGNATDRDHADFHIGIEAAPLVPTILNPNHYRLKQ